MGCSNVERADPDMWNPDSRLRLIHHSDSMMGGILAICCDIWFKIHKPIWVNFITTEPCSPEPWESWLINKGNHPKIAELFRFVKYYYLPRYMSSFSCVNDPSGSLVYLQRSRFICIQDHFFKCRWSFWELLDFFHKKSSSESIVIKSRNNIPSEW